MPEPKVGSDHPLAPLMQQWAAKLKVAYDQKKKLFQDDADEAMRFFNGPYDWIYDVKNARGGSAFSFVGEETEMPRLSFQMTVNKAAELVQLFGPALYHRNPVRQVTPRKLWGPPPELLGDPNDPNVQMMYQQIQQQVSQGRLQDEARASLLTNYLNYTPTALDLKSQSRFAIVEALLKGMGTLWPETYLPAGGGGNMVGSFYKTVDYLLIDPDAEVLDDAKWVAVMCVHPYWEVERTYGLPQDSLRGSSTLESMSQQAVTAADPKGQWNRKTGRTNDLMVYWKVFSKMGMGGRMSSGPGSQPKFRDRLDSMGDYSYIVVSDQVGYPLNAQPELSRSLVDDDENVRGIAQEALKSNFEWPTPFWCDDEWPFKAVAFHWQPRCVWPVSHLRPGMGELKFLNWAYSMMAGKIKNSCRDFIAIAKSAGEDLKENIRVGPDYTFLEVDAIHGSIDKLVQFLQHPGFNKDIYEVLERIADSFERRTGLTELMYGLSNKQMRSAEEAQVKGDQTNVRPDDMANKVEDAMSELARMEAFAARWHLGQDDVQGVLGDVGAQAWQTLVLAESPAAILHGLEYRIEAGSARKPNQSRDAANARDAMQSLFQPLYAYAGQSGDVGPVNALIGFWGKSLNMDVGKFMLKAPPPPQPGPPMPAGKPPHGNGVPQGPGPPQGPPMAMAGGVR